AGQSPNLFFIDQNHGWLLLPTEGTTSARLYSTEDAGLHWNLITSSVPWDARPLVFGPSLFTFSSLTTGWMSGEKLMVTHDSGLTWNIQPLPMTLSDGSYVGAPTFFDPQHGIAYCCSTGGPGPDLIQLLVTSDG